MKLTLNIEKRYVYAIIGLLIILVGIFIVNALTPGQTPNPGHPVSQLGVPSPCANGQVLSYNGNTWVCKTDDLEVPSPCVNGQVLSYNGITWVCKTDSGWATNATISLTNCQWSTRDLRINTCGEFGPDYVQIGHDTTDGGSRMLIYCCKLVINLQS